MHPWVPKCNRWYAGNQPYSMDDVPKIAHVPWPPQALRRRQKLSGTPLLLSAEAQAVLAPCSSKFARHQSPAHQTSRCYIQASAHIPSQVFATCPLSERLVSCSRLARTLPASLGRKFQQGNGGHVLKNYAAPWGFIIHHLHPESLTWYLWPKTIWFNTAPAKAVFLGKPRTWLLMCTYKMVHVLKRWVLCRMAGWFFLPMTNSHFSKPPNHTLKNLYQMAFGLLQNGLSSCP